MSSQLLLDCSDARPIYSPLRFAGAEVHWILYTMGWNSFWLGILVKNPKITWGQNTFPVCFWMMIWKKNKKNLGYGCLFERIHMIFNWIDLNSGFCEARDTLWTKSTNDTYVLHTTSNEATSVFKFHSGDQKGNFINCHWYNSTLQCLFYRSMNLL